MLLLTRKLASRIVGTGVLDCPLEKKLIRRKQIINPDRFLKVCRGYCINIIPLCYPNPYLIIGVNSDI